MLPIKLCVMIITVMRMMVTMMTNDDDSVVCGYDDYGDDGNDVHHRPPSLRALPGRAA